MKFSPKNIVLLIFTTIVLVGCSSHKPQLKPLIKGDVVVAFGDSLTYGIGASTDMSYPADLERLIGYQVINAGEPGETTSQGLERLPEVLQKYNPALVILCLGGNDLIRKIPPKKIKQNLRKMILFIKHHNASVILIGVPRPSIGLIVPDFYQELGKEFDIPVDTTILPSLLKTNKYKADLIHLNEVGYQKLANSIREILKEYRAI